MPKTVQNPCGKAATSVPKLRYREGELVVRLNPDAVRRNGYLSKTLPVFELLRRAGAVRVETLRTFTLQIQGIARPEVLRLEFPEEQADRQPAVFYRDHKIGGDWTPPLQDELALLRVFFGPKSKNPSQALIDCLYTVPGVGLAEEIPLMVLPEPAISDSAGSKVVPWATDAIHWAEPPAMLSSPQIAVLDDDFDQNGHGFYVRSVIEDLLPGASIVNCPVAESGNLKRPESVLDPSLYYTVLRDIRTNGKAKVVNISRGQPTPSQLEAQELALVEGAGVLVVASAGNMESEETIQFPGGYATVFSVGAMDESNSIWKLSCYGLPSWAKCVVRKTDSVDVVAPGVDISSDRWSGLLTGTSFAAPFVTALAAMLRGMHPNATNGFIRDLIRDAASTQALGKPSGRPTEVWGRGLINWDLSVAGQKAQ